VLAVSLGAACVGIWCLVVLLRASVVVSMFCIGVVSVLVEGLL
jgi:hypothetical protein